MWLQDTIDLAPLVLFVAVMILRTVIQNNAIALTWAIGPGCRRVFSHRNCVFYLLCTGPCINADYVIGIWRVDIQRNIIAVAPNTVDIVLLVQLWSGTFWWLRRALSNKTLLKRVGGWLCVAGWQNRSFPLFQNVTRDHSPRCDVVCPFPFFASKCGEFSSRERDWNQSWSRTVLVEQTWSDVRSRDPAETDQSDAFLLKLAVAFGRNLREDQWWNALLDCHYWVQLNPDTTPKSVYRFARITAGLGCIGCLLFQGHGKQWRKVWRHH